MTAAKPPTPQGISALLKRAGFERSNHGKPGVGYGEVTTGFVCWKSHHAGDGPQQPYVAVQHDVEGMFNCCGDKDEWAAYLREARYWLEKYARTVRRAGYAPVVRDRGSEPPWLTILTVVAAGKAEQ